jgi:hypothetical protein
VRKDKIREKELYENVVGKSRQKAKWQLWCFQVLADGG